MSPDTHQVREIAEGVFSTVLEPCSRWVLPHVLRPEPASFVWLVGYRPHSRGQWVDLPLPLSQGRPAEPLRVRYPVFELQLPLIVFLDRLPAINSWSGLLLHQMARPVPDTLRYESFSGTPGEYHILRQNGWLLTFYLPHDGEHARITCPDRTHLEGVLADPIIATHDLP
jgi:hypothetical protein